ncbi:hypothetical protein C8F04DRAFT_1194678 [Mycena alexandri]|uniref:Uncharacterized protein n=1 Tax=Mycena alexandri TaxID=1745969 RepID=A0AAD6S7Z8_9AGAR|nr:hypothetical protein C8F04DRAFT_1194678 [Mycena alexandri]
MADATQRDTADTLTQAEDRAYKQLAINGAPLTADLRGGIDRYVPGPPVWKPKPAGYVAGAAVRERVAARALAAARERPALEGKAFMQRSLGIPANPCPKPPGYVAGAAVREHVAARRARVDMLMEMRKPRACPRGFVRLGPISEPALSREAREKAAKAGKDESEGGRRGAAAARGERRQHC